jgi:hypothetical protein
MDDSPYPEQRSLFENQDIIWHENKNRYSIIYFYFRAFIYFV